MEVDEGGLMAVADVVAAVRVLAAAVAVAVVVVGVISIAVAVATMAIVAVAGLWFRKARVDCE